MDLRKELAKDDGKIELLAGAGLGAYGLAGIAVGAVCPVCVIGTPLLLGLGAYKKIRYKKQGK